jgi:hypothetical protein
LDGLLAAGRLLAAAGFGTGAPPPPLPIKPEIDCSSVPPAAVPKFEPAAATFITPGAYAAAALHATPRRRRRRNSGRFLVVFGFLVVLSFLVVFGLGFLAAKRNFLWLHSRLVNMGVQRRKSIQLVSIKLFA